MSTIKTIGAGIAVSAGDLFPTRQGADIVDTSVTATQLKTFMSNAPTLVTPNIGTATGTRLILTSASATALAVGANGSTNPAFVVDASFASSVTGLKVASLPAGSGVNISIISSFTDESLNISPKGQGDVNFNAGLNNNFKTGGTTRMAISATTFFVSNLVGGAGTGSKFSYTAPSGDVNITASTEAQNVLFDFTNGRQHATGALTNQREFIIKPSNHAFIGASTLTNAATFAVLGPTAASTNATITNASAILVTTAALNSGGTVTNGYGLNVAAPTGATNNYAAKLGALTVDDSGNAVSTGNYTSGSNGGTVGSLKLFGNTSGDVTIKAAAAAGTATNFTLPATNGTNTYVLQTDGAGNTSWVAPSGGGGGTSLGLVSVMSLFTAYP